MSQIAFFLQHSEVLQTNSLPLTISRMLYQQKISQKKTHISVDQNF